MPVKHCLWRTRYPSFVKASVLCRLPNQRERLKHSFVGAKPAGVPTLSQSSVSKMIFFFFYYSKQSEFRIRKEHTKGASEPVK